MFILKACPKCRGDLVTTARLRDLDPAAEVSCLQCGYVMQPQQSRSLFARIAPRPQPVLEPALVPVRR